MNREKERKIYVVGHKNPDTDSICSALAYANLKNQISDGEFEYEPCRAGNVNGETKFVLEHFGVKAPEYVNDMRPRVTDININRIEGVEESTSIKEAGDRMRQIKQVSLPVLHDRELKGIVTISDVAYADMDVFDNVLTAMHLRSRANVFSSVLRLSHREEKAMRDETEKLLKEQGLWKHRGDKATSLPYGYQRRLEIARALATKPHLLLLDEPAAGMNPQETLELAAFIHEIKEKYSLTVLMIEHHMDLVMGISDRVYVLDFGSLIAEGTPEEIQGNQRVIDAYLGVSEDV